MPPKSLKDAFLVILDCSEDSQKCTSKDGESFFSRAKKCVLRIFEKKIFAYSNDEVGLFLMGFPGSHRFSNGNVYKNMKEELDMMIASWESCRHIEQSVVACSQKADWFEALNCAVDTLQDKAARSYGKMNIILMTTLESKTKASGEDIKEFIDKIKVQKSPSIELIVINDNIETSQDEEFTFSQSVSKTQDQESSETLINEIIKETNGVLCNLENAELQLLYYEKKKVRSTPRYYTFKIGEKITMEVVEYKKVDEPKLLKSWGEMTIGGEELVKKTKYFQNDEEVQVTPFQTTSTDSPMDVDHEIIETITGYMFGPDPIACDIGFKLEYGDKSLLCIGFSDAKYVRSEFLSEKLCNVILPQFTYKWSIKKFASLVKALYDTNYVIIARKVISKRSEPKIVALFPEYTDDKKPYLVCIGLHCVENCIDIKYPSLRNAKKFEPTQEQYDIMDQLIDDMDLMKVGNEKSGNAEAFALNKTLNIYHQHQCRVIAHRALHPNEPVQKISEELTALIDVPPKIKEKSKETLIKAKELFVLEENKEPTKLELLQERLKKISTKADEVDGNTLVEDVDIKTNHVGTVVPAEDFLFLVNKGILDFGTATRQLQEVIQKLTFKDFTISRVKILKALTAYRAQAIDMRPENYNSWIVRYKDDLLSHEKQDFFKELLVDEKLGLITTEESNMSNVTPEMAAEFYRVSEKTAFVAPVADAADDDWMELME